MACTIEDITDHFDPRDFDKALGDLLLVHEGNTLQYLVTVLDFLKRKSNFFKQGDPKKRLLEAYKQVAGDGDGFRSGFFGGPSKPSSSSAAAQAVKPATAVAGASSTAGAAAAASPPAATGSAPQAAAAAGEAAGPSSEAVPAQPPCPDVEEEPEDSDQNQKGLAPNAGRGADLERYSWTQTLGEVTVNVPVGGGVKAKLLDVAIAKQHLRVGVKGEAPIIDADLAEPIKADECLWNLSDGMVELTLTKAEGMHWWSRVCAGDPEINVQKVEPENSKLTDLDPETRTTVEKMMFDQRQKALGLPTSEEAQKQEMLRKFMSAHPEMDFSNAKIM